MRKRFLLKIHRAIRYALLVGLLVGSGCSGTEDAATEKERRERLTVLFSSDLLGKVRSCGCSVKDVGGLGRRASYTEEVRNNVANLLVLDAGDAFGSDLSYLRNEAELTFDTFELMGLDAFTPGEVDYIFGLDFLKAAAEQYTFDIVAANVVDPGTGEPVFGRRYIVRELKGGIKVGITGILDETIRFPGYIDSSLFAVVSHEEALRDLLAPMKREADFLILISHMGLERSRALAGKIKDFHLIIVGHGKPITKETMQVGETVLLATGGLGQYIGRCDLRVSETGAFQLDRMKIDVLTDDIPVHGQVEQLFESYGVPLTEKQKKK